MHNSESGKVKIQTQTNANRKIHQKSRKNTHQSDSWGGGALGTGLGLLYAMSLFVFEMNAWTAKARNLL